MFELKPMLADLWNRFVAALTVLAALGTFVVADGFAGYPRERRQISNLCCLCRQLPRLGVWRLVRAPVLRRFAYGIKWENGALKQLPRAAPISEPFRLMQKKGQGVAADALAPMVPDR